KRSLTPIDIQEKNGVAGGGRSPAPPPPSISGGSDGGSGGYGQVQAPKAKRRSFGVAKPGIRKREEIVIFTRQLATMIGAGIPLLESLEILKEQAESKQFSLLLDAVIGDVRSGQDFSSSLDRLPQVFTNDYVRSG